MNSFDKIENLNFACIISNLYVTNRTELEKIMKSHSFELSFYDVNIYKSHAITLYDNNIEETEVTCLHHHSF